METTFPGNTPATFGNSANSGGVLNKASSGAHAVVNAIAGAADEASRKAQPAVGKAAALAHQAVDKAAGAVVPTADWLTEQGGKLHATQKKMVEESSSFVKANPLKTIGFALVAGFLLSRIVRK